MKSVDVNSCQEAGYVEADWGFDGGRERSQGGELRQPGKGLLLIGCRHLLWSSGLNVI